MGDGCTGITWKRDFPEINYEVELSKPFGIASWNTTAALRNIKVTSIGK
jgi:hypothetical protein